MMEKVRTTLTCGNTAQVMLFDRQIGLPGVNYIRGRADMDKGASHKGNYSGGKPEEMSCSSRRQITDFQNKTGNIGKMHFTHKGSLNVQKYCV